MECDAHYYIFEFVVRKTTTTTKKVNSLVGYAFGIAWNMWVKTPTPRTRARRSKSLLHSQVQLPANVSPGRQPVRAHAVESLQPTGEIYTEIVQLHPGSARVNERYFGSESVGKRAFCFYAFGEKNKFFKNLLSANCEFFLKMPTKPLRSFIIIWWKTK